VSRARLAAHALRLLGPVAGPVAVTAPRRLRAHLASRLVAARDGDVPVAALVAFLGSRARPAARQALLAAVRDRLPASAPVVLLDHGQPRALWRRVVGAAVLALRGLGPARARYPAARELAALGFAVERMCLACGERVQIVLARRRPPSTGDARPLDAPADVSALWRPP